jgi:SAM-dependent methyltransferase
VATSVFDADHWDVQYRAGPLAWETGRPSAELAHVLTEWAIRPCRAIELGCGTGTNAVWLASRGFDVTAVDLSCLAIRRAIRRAASAGVGVHFRIGDLRGWQDFEGPFEFFYDGGCYHAVRLEDPDGYFATLDHVLQPGALGLVLLGNDREPEDDAGPPGVDEATIRREFGGLFEVLRLREFRFDAPPGGRHYLGWSCLLRRRIATRNWASHKLGSRRILSEPIKAAAACDRTG